MVFPWHVLEHLTLDDIPLEPAINGYGSGGVYRRRESPNVCRLGQKAAIRKYF